MQNKKFLSFQNKNLIKKLNIMNFFSDQYILDFCINKIKISINGMIF